MDVRIRHYTLWKQAVWLRSAALLRDAAPVAV